jgi:hypothetical protein
MSTPIISGTQSPSVSGLFVGHHGLYRKQLSPSPPALIVPTDTSAAEPLASAIAAALTQLGLTPATGATASNNTVATGSAPSAPLPSQQKASPQIQQYKNMSATFSSLAQALNASTNGVPSSTDGTSSLTSAFQSLWKSMGASSGTATSASTDASSGSMPSLQSFLESLARQFSESGVSGLRGVFVDTVV